MASTWHVVVTAPVRYPGIMQAGSFVHAWALADIHAAPSLPFVAGAHPSVAKMPPFAHAAVPRSAAVEGSCLATPGSSRNSGREKSIYMTRKLDTLPLGPWGASDQKNEGATYLNRVAPARVHE